MGRAGNRTRRSVPALERDHRGSHVGLLRSSRLDPPGSSDVDAIIVPISHPTDHLRTALTLARQLSCPLVALCSQHASVHDAMPLADEVGAELVAIDFADIPGDLLPRFATTDLLGTTPFDYIRDTSAKRNLGLLLASLMGWQRIVFLDDDIEVPNPGDLRRAAHLLDRYAAVGLVIDYFPDNSVVCHAHRAAGGGQETFIGGGALAVGTAAMSSFFPKIYNEDWFFLLDGARLCPATMVGSAVQHHYDPYDSVHRAELEEFGDCMGEGVFHLLDSGRTIRGATRHQYWQQFLDRRLLFIEHVIERVEASGEPAPEQQRMIAALAAAHARSALINPLTCVDYLRTWRDDRALWRRHVDALQREYQTSLNRLGQLARLEKVLSELGLMECSCLTMM